MSLPTIGQLFGYTVMEKQFYLVMIMSYNKRCSKRKKYQILVMLVKIITMAID